MKTLASPTRMSYHDIRVGEMALMSLVAGYDRRAGHYCPTRYCTRSAKSVHENTLVPLSTLIVV